MKHVLLFFVFLLIMSFSLTRVSQSADSDVENRIGYQAHDQKDTCIIEGQAFRMYDSKSKRVMRAYIKNNQLLVVNEGLQFAKYRIIQYVFSSLTDEQMPSYRWYNQRISPPILKILKNAIVGQQYVFEEIVIVDQQNNVLSNDVRPLMIERIKN